MPPTPPKNSGAADAISLGGLKRRRPQRVLLAVALDVGRIFLNANHGTKRWQTLTLT